MIMDSRHDEPFSLGQDRMIKIIEPPENVANISGTKVRRRYDLTRPQGIRGRDSENTRFQDVPKCEPEGSVEIRFGTTRNWIHEQLLKTGRSTSEEQIACPLGSFQYQNPSFNAKND